MQYTTNYNLPKAEMTDAPPDITFVGEGFDIVDEALKEHDDSFVWHADRKNELQESINALAEQLATKTWTPFCVNSGILDSNGKPALMSYANDVSTSTELAFVQPILTANGTMGGTAFAVTANQSTASAYAPFSTGTGGITSVGEPTAAAPFEITIYNPVAVKLSDISMQNPASSNNVWSSVILYGSNSNGAWTEISRHNNGLRTANQWGSIGVNPNAYYKYYKLSFTSNTANAVINIQKINLSGTYISTHTGGRVTFTGTVIATTAQGENFTADEIKNLDLSSVTANKVYIYLGRNGAPTYTAGALHISPTTPTEFAAGDVWFKTLEPLAAYQYLNSAWSEINLAPVGEVTMDGAGKITAVTTYPYNQNGYTVNVGTQATASTFGLVRTAGAEDETDCQCDDAAVTPENLYKLANYRLANTAYAVGDVVACPYHVEFLLKCTTAGTTSAGALNTTEATAGQVLADGGAQWTVIAKAIIDASISGKVITLTFADGTTKTLVTQDTNTTYSAATTSAAGLMSAADKTKLNGITANVAYKLPYATCSTAKATAAKVATITNSVPFSLVAGAMVTVKFTQGVNNASTYNITTLNVNSTGAKTVKVPYAKSGGVGQPMPDHQNNTYTFVFDGTYWNGVFTPNDFDYASSGT